MRAVKCLALLGVVLLGGCKGYLGDRLRPKEAVLAGELERYIPDGALRTCLGNQLKANLSVWQLRQLADLAQAGRRAGTVQLDPRGLVYVASQVTDPRVSAALSQASTTCGASGTTLAATPRGPVSAPAAPAGGRCASTRSSSPAVRRRPASSGPAAPRSPISRPRAPRRSPRPSAPRPPRRGDRPGARSRRP